MGHGPPLLAALLLASLVACDSKLAGPPADGSRDRAGSLDGPAPELSRFDGARVEASTADRPGAVERSLLGGPDVSTNTDPTLDITAQANKVGGFLLACGAAAGDLLVVEASDRDAGYYSSIGQNRWWDATNAKLPTFNQHFTWARALSEKVGRPLLWWQLPVGNMSLPNKTDQWQDNRVDYFFGHTQQVADSHGVGMAFGAGMGGQTTPETDNGNLVARVKAYSAAGGQAPSCP